MQGAGLDLVGAGLGRLSGSNHIASLYFLIVFMFSLFCAFLNIFFKPCFASLSICLSFCFVMFYCLKDDMMMIGCSRRFVKTT